jgi:hypothetical protein
MDKAMDVATFWDEVVNDFFGGKSKATIAARC